MVVHVSLLPFAVGGQLPFPGTSQKTVAVIPEPADVLVLLELGLLLLIPGIAMLGGIAT